MTETAIGLMKAVLENVSPRRGHIAKPIINPAVSQPEPLKNLSSLVKAQLIYFSTAAETLSVSIPCLHQVKRARASC
jgi:hypothetical protein